MGVTTAHNDDYRRFTASRDAAYVTRVVKGAGRQQNPGVLPETWTPSWQLRAVGALRSASTDPHADTYLPWVAMHGLATLDKPARSDYLRLGPIDRPAALTALVHRLARITAPETPAAS
jgi:hypothetical protein